MLVSETSELLELDETVLVAVEEDNGTDVPVDEEVVLRLVDVVDRAVEVPVLETAVVPLEDTLAELVPALEIEAASVEVELLEESKLVVDVDWELLDCVETLEFGPVLVDAVDVEAIVDVLVS